MRSPPATSRPISAAEAAGVSQPDNPAQDVGWDCQLETNHDLNTRWSQITSPGAREVRSWIRRAADQLSHRPARDRAPAQHAPAAALRHGSLVMGCRRCGRASACRSSGTPKRRRVIRIRIDAPSCAGTTKMQCRLYLVKIAPAGELTWSNWVTWLVPETFSGGHEADDADAYCQVASQSRAQVRALHRDGGSREHTARAVTRHGTTTASVNISRCRHHSLVQQHGHQVFL